MYVDMNPLSLHPCDLFYIEKPNEQYIKPLGPCKQTTYPCAVKLGHAVFVNHSSALHARRVTLQCIVGKAFMNTRPKAFVQACSMHGIARVCFDFSKFMRAGEVRSTVWLLFQWVTRPQCCCSIRGSLLEAAVTHVCYVSPVLLYRNDHAVTISTCEDKDSQSHGTALVYSLEIFSHTAHKPVWAPQHGLIYLALFF